MIMVHGNSARSWIAIVLGFALGLWLESHSALGQRQDELLPAPRAFAPTRAVRGSEYAGMEYDPHGFRSVSQRFGSALPIGGDEDEGEIIYEGEPRFLDGSGEIIGTPGEGEILYESGPAIAGVPYGGPCDSCGDEGCLPGDACGGCGTWDGCGLAECDDCVSLCLPRFKHLTLFGGVQGFKGPRDLGTGSNFGFHEGILVSGRAPFVGWRGIGYQVGYRAVQSRLHGDLVSRSARSQHFLTAGLFRRSQVGLQYGVAFDYMRDDLVEDVGFSQLRTDISVLGPRGGEIGFLGAFGLNRRDILIDNDLLRFEPTDQFLLFVRQRFAFGSEGRLWSGLTNFGDGIFGGEFLVPLDDRWSLAGGFNYLLPENDRPPLGTLQEAWNVGLSLVWHWNCDARTWHNSPFRPLFNVADNGTMIIGRR